LKSMFSWNTIKSIFYTYQKLVEGF
jgi:hypothetical protein